MKTKNLNFNQSGASLVVIIIAILLTAVLAGGFTYVWQNQQATNKIKNIEQEKNSYQNKTDDLQKQLAEKEKNLADLEAQKQAAEEAARWQTYNSENYNLSFEYLKGWQINDALTPDKPNGWVGIGLSSAADLRDFSWVIRTEKISATSLDKIIGGLGDQFNDRQESRESITINGLNATVATVISPSNVEFSTKMIVFEKNNKFYIVTGPANDKDFDKFYQSLVIN